MLEIIMDAIGFPVGWNLVALIKAKAWRPLARAILLSGVKKALTMNVAGIAGLLSVFSVHCAIWAQQKGDISYG